MFSIFNNIIDKKGRRSTRAASRHQTVETVQYEIARESDEDVLQYETVAEYDEHMGEDNLVEEYLTEEIETFDDATAFDEDPFSGVNDDGNVETTVYTCNACGIEITNVDEHINEFHSGQEIIVDMEDRPADEDYMTVVYKQEPGEEIDADDPNEYTLADEDDDQYTYTTLVDEPEELKANVVAKSAATSSNAVILICFMSIILCKLNISLTL